jgi:hypothetical protein
MIAETLGLLIGLGRQQDVGAAQVRAIKSASGKTGAPTHHSPSNFPHRFGPPVTKRRPEAIAA